MAESIAVFTDYYETLEVSPNANSETVERIFRYLASRYHPDNRETGDLSRFTEVVRAHDTLKDPVKRAQYDVQFKEHSNASRELTTAAANPGTVEHDLAIQAKLLSYLYAKRRKDFNNPGIGSIELERVLNCPREHLEFHLWYVKAKGWIKVDDGMFAITVEGIDRVNAEGRRDATATIKLLEKATARGAP
jgi:curved DNA-binding protein CbpA